MEATGSPETLITVYKTIKQQNPEDHNPRMKIKCGYLAAVPLGLRNAASYAVIAHTGERRAASTAAR
jgi:hypothetical protein